MFKFVLYQQQNRDDMSAFNCTFLVFLHQCDKVQCLCSCIISATKPRRYVRVPLHLLGVYISMSQGSRLQLVGGFAPTSTELRPSMNLSQNLLFLTTWRRFLLLFIISVYYVRVVNNILNSNSHSGKRSSIAIRATIVTLTTRMRSYSQSTR